MDLYQNIKKQKNRVLRFMSLKTGKTLAPPSLLIVHPTNRCNQNCYMCFTQPRIKKANQRDGVELSGEKILELISDAKNWGVERIWFTGGGEPLLRREIHEMLRKVKSLGLKGLMSTNGTLLDEKIGTLLIELQWDQIIFSIDAATPESYGLIRGGDYLGKITSNIRRLSQLKKEHSSSKPEMIIYTVVLPENYSTLDKIIEFGHSIGVSKVIFGNAFPESPTSILTPQQEEEAKESYKRASELAKKLGVKTNIQLFLKKRYYLENLICTKPWTQMGIRFDGNVEPCALSTELMGNVNRNSLQNIWGGAEYGEIRKKRFNREFAKYCDNCDIYDQHMFHFLNDFYRHPMYIMKFLQSESFV